MMQLARALLTMRHHPLHIVLGIGIGLTAPAKLGIGHVRTLVLAKVKDGGTPHVHAVHMIRQIWEWAKDARHEAKEAGHEQQSEE